MNTIAFSFEQKNGCSKLEITVPESWETEESGLFIRFISPNGWILEMMPVVRVIHAQTRERHNLFEESYASDDVSRLCVDGLQLEWSHFVKVKDPYVNPLQITEKAL